jgi:Peptidase family M41
MTSVTRFIDKRTLVAFHEAGHAVVGTHFGKYVRDITLLEGEHDTINAATTMEALKLNSSRAVIEAEVKICLAGLCAELIGFHQHHDGHTLDFENARFWSQVVALQTGEPRNAVLHRLERAVQDELRQPALWAAVETVAEYVLRYRAIDGGTIHQIVRHHGSHPSRVDFDAFKRFN